MYNIILSTINNGYVGASSASAKIANGNTFYLKVSCMAS